MAGKMMTQQQLCDAVYTAVFKSKKPLSRREICEGIGKHKSPHIIKMIEHLAAHDYFKKESRIDDFGRAGFIYSVVGKKQSSACEGIEQERELQSA